MKLTIKPSFYFLGGMLATCILIAVFSFDEPHSNKEKPSSTTNVFNAWHVPALPSQYSFAGENVPMDRPEVFEYFDRNFTQIYYQTGTMLNVMKLTGRWFPLIEERLKYHGVPDDFKYLCVAESNLQNLISRAGAVGFWQFMPATAPGYNLQVNSKVDERYHVLKSTDAACKYLKEAYAQFGSWTAAAASYNCGKGGYNSRAVQQKTKDYYALQLPEETNNYIFRILSFKYLFENAAQLGYAIKPENFYQPFQTKKIEVRSSIHDLASFAIERGTSYKMIKILNPWLRDRNLIVSGGKTYTLHLPADTAISK